METGMGTVQELTAEGRIVMTAIATVGKATVAAVEAVLWDKHLSVMETTW
jgi:hypothetical protein